VIIPFIAAGVFLLFAFVVHLCGGTKEYLTIRPSRDTVDFQHWTLGAACFQMVTVDLFITGAFALMLGMDLIEYNHYLALFITLMYAGYLVMWLATLATLKVEAALYKRLGQWAIFLISGALMVWGMIIQ